MFGSLDFGKKKLETTEHTANNELVQLPNNLDSWVLSYVNGLMFGSMVLGKEETTENSFVRLLIIKS